MEHTDNKYKTKAKDKKKNNMKGRIIVRNLNFKVDEEKVRTFFKRFGNIKEISLLKKPDGSVKGVGFVQYENKLAALKAIKECNMKPFMGRPIAVDIAIPKDRYTASKQQQTRIEKSEDIQDLNTKRKCNDDEDESTFTAKVHFKKFKKDLDVNSENDEESEDENSENDEENSENDEENSENDEENSENDEENSDDESGDKHNDGDKQKGKKTENELQNEKARNSKDVTEGLTIFLRNVSIDSTEDQIKQILSQFGELKYVLFCKDKVRQRFRGSAFAQFLSRDAADCCLGAFEDPAHRSIFHVGGRTFSVARALGREDIQEKQKVKDDGKKTEKKDKRNLYLCREGVIREGSKAAIGVSKHDLSLRNQREVVKRGLLTNFNTFVSPVRLYICNLPVELSDKELRRIFKKYSVKGAEITECRIMRNMYNLDDKGVPMSKGYGFVTFSQHNHALEALRNTNNNPDIFTKDSRPVVEFSMENEGALKARAKRLQKSRELNAERQAPEFVGSAKQSSQASEEKPEFMGSNFDPTKTRSKAFHSHVGPKIRHRNRISRKNINKQTKNSREVQQKRNSKSFKDAKGKKTKVRKNASWKKSSANTSNNASKKKKIKFI